MNSEKSYDSLPNFTAADCEFSFLRFPLLSHNIEMTLQGFCVPPTPALFVSLASFYLFFFHSSCF